MNIIFNIVFLRKMDIIFSSTYLIDNDIEVYKNVSEVAFIKKID